MKESIYKAYGSGIHMRVAISYPQEGVAVSTSNSASQ